MTITTNQFSITKNEYFKIILQLKWKKFWWLYIGTLLLAIYFLQDYGKDSFATFFTIYGFFNIPFLITYYYFWTHSKDNRIVFLPRTFTIDTEKISADVDGIVSEIPLKFIIKTIQLKSYWILYISKGQFIFIPESAFKNEADKLQFNKSVLTA